ncbi:MULTISPECIES: TauD/TfdA dioxygenase family protein [Nocardia]|uniref:TauD/TfdA dioxygenase family protein n=1 Tax=Nocardia TaxID=1817 RepID=UPI0007C55061|nr:MULTISPECIES: TauD/TfdA family dioxygenase [Nocardia]
MSRYHIDPLASTFGAEVFGIDLSGPLEESVSASLIDDLLKYRVLVVRDQALSHEDHIRVSRVFGEPEIHVQDQFTVPGFAQIVTISNIHRNGVPIGLYDGDNEQEWHTDLSFRPAMSSVSLLYSVIAPEVGGQTRFADTTAAYDDLPAELRARVDGLEAVHSMVHLFERQAADNPAKVPLTEAQRARVPDVVHPLVRQHPQTGRRSLLLGEMIIRNIVGLDESESASLLDRLHAHATAERYVYSHRWAVGDLVIWDNRATMHTASPCDHTRHQRLLYRTTVM